MPHPLELPVLSLEDLCAYLPLAPVGELLPDGDGGDHREGIHCSHSTVTTREY